MCSKIFFSLLFVLLFKKSITYKLTGFNNQLSHSEFPDENVYDVGIYLIFQFFGKLTITKGNVFLCF